MSAKAGPAAGSAGKAKAAPPTPVQGKKGAATAAADKGRGKAATVDEDSAASAAPPLTPPPPPPTPFDLLPEVWALPTLPAQRARLCELLGLVDGSPDRPSLQRVEVDEAVLHLRFASALQLNGAQTGLLYQMIRFIHLRLTDPQPLLSPSLIDTVRSLLNSHCTEALSDTQPVDCSALLPTLTFPPLPLPPPPFPAPPEVTPTSSRPATAAGKKAHAATPAARQATAAASPRPPSSSAAKTKPQVKNAPVEAAAASAEVVPLAEAPPVGGEAAVPLPPPPPPHFLTPLQLSAVFNHLHDRVLQHIDLYRAAWSRGSGSAEVGVVVANIYRPPIPSDWVMPLEAAVEEEGLKLDDAQPEGGERNEAGGGGGEDVELSLSPAVAGLTAEERSRVMTVKAELERQLRQARAEAKATAAPATAAAAVAAL